MRNQCVRIKGVNTVFTVLDKQTDLYQLKLQIYSTCHSSLSNRRVNTIFLLPFVVVVTLVEPKQSSGCTG